MVIMQYISVFFSGFILSEFEEAQRRDPNSSLVKLPFPMTLGFKSLLSKDIILPDLDVRWVSWVFHYIVISRHNQLTRSALSWYFLNLFGLNGVFRLILGDQNG